MKKCWTTPFPHCFTGASFPVLWVLLCQEDKKHAQLSGSYALSESFTKKTSCHFQHSTQISGIKSKTIKYQAQWNTLTQPTTVIAHVLSLRQLALSQWPHHCHLGVFLLSGRKEGLDLDRNFWNFWKGGFGLALPPRHSLEHCVPWTAEEHEGGAGSGWCSRQSWGCSIEPCAHSPLLSIPTEAWKRGSDRHETLHETLQRSSCLVFIEN